MVEPFFLYDEDIELLLFGGKGGVGKTSCATATALKVAKRFPERSLLLVSTDPAHSLADSMAGFSTSPNLQILELDAMRALEVFKNKHDNKLREIALRGTFLDDEDISRFMTLSLPGMDELMAFLDISGWVIERRYDLIIVDTAPTGHTLRLLSMPDVVRKWLEALDTLLAKHRYMRQLFGGSYQKDELDEFLLRLSTSVKEMESLLQDQVRCRFVPVMIGEKLCVQETMNLVNELKRIKVSAGDMVINRLFPKSSCMLCEMERTRQMKEVERVFKELPGHTLWAIPLYTEEIRGPVTLTFFWDGVFLLKEEDLEIGNWKLETGNTLLTPLVEGPAPSPLPDMKLLIFAGKGGVGKTTMACASALRIAQDLKEKKVFLFSTDPAHSLSDCLDMQVGPEPKELMPGLTAMEIDAALEFEFLKREYAEELKGFLAAVSPNLDLTFDREVMERMMDLSPPGLDEVMAMARVMEFLSQEIYDIFILDSAPTGHLIRLLETPEIIDQWLKAFFELFLKYKRVFHLPKMAQRLVQVSKEIKLLRTLLNDPACSALYCVTILTEMAFQETMDLIRACDRMAINVPVIILNLASPENECPLCSALYQRETHIRKKFKDAFPGKSQTLVYRRGEVRGLQQLVAMGEALYE
jgi:arsenite-transporting ATPase